MRKYVEVCHDASINSSSSVAVGVELNPDGVVVVVKAGVSPRVVQPETRQQPIYGPL